MSSPTRPPSQRPATQQRPGTQQRPATQQRSATEQRPGTRAATGTQRPGTAAAAGKGTGPFGRPVVLAACVGAVAVLVALVALIRPFSRAAVDGHGDATAEAEAEAPVEAQPAPEPALEAAASRPRGGAALAALVGADAAYESGDFKAARDLYLELLLTGGDFGGDDGEEVTRWAHGRLALATARLARAPGTKLLDEPVFRFRETAK